MSNKKYFKCVIKIEVLCEDAPVPPDMSIGDIEYEISSGDWSGQISYESVDELTPDQMREELIKQGSDPAFMDLEND